MRRLIEITATTLASAIILLFLGAVIYVLSACTKQGEAPTATSTATMTAVEVFDCSLVTETLALKNQTAKLPKTGRFVLESHLVTNSDPDGYPATVSTNIDKHLWRSCMSLQDYGANSSCSDVYKLIYHKQWTPAEAGKIGQGSVGTLRPTVEQEMWSFNMYWDGNKPSPGEKFLLSYKGKNVVAASGFETGPGSATFLGGVQGEIHWYLGSDSDSQVKIGRLKNQSLAYGPVECK